VAGVGVTVWLGRRASPTEGAKPPDSRNWIGGLIALTGLGWLIGAAIMLTQTLEGLVKELQIGGIEIGTTLIAAVVSLRRIVFTMSMAGKGEGNRVLESAIGGSLIMLLFGLGGLGLGMPPANLPDSLLHKVFPASLAAGLLLLPTYFSGLTTRRWEGLLHLAA